MHQVRGSQAFLSAEPLRYVHIYIIYLHTWVHTLQEPTNTTSYNTKSCLKFFTLKCSNPLAFDDSVHKNVGNYVNV